MVLNTINLSDNIEFIKTLPDNSIDAVITDSPYGLGKEPKVEEVLFNWLSDGYHLVKGTGFMGKKWDAFVPQPVLWKECYRVLKPGGYLLSFFGTRTYDWGTLAIRLAGFEIRDCIQWIYGSGFPKSKACLKPANEPICVAMKPGPLRKLGIDEARIPADWLTDPNKRVNGKKPSQTLNTYGKDTRTEIWDQNPLGRVPSNVILDEVTASILDEQSGWSNSARKSPRIEKTGNSVVSKHGGFGIQGGRPIGFITHGFDDNGGASRFFYVAKASPSERAGMKHPTIKPVKLMLQLVKLYCPVGGVVLDPHFGTGPTGEACLESGRNYIGVDNDPESVEEAKGRIDRWNFKNPPNLFTINDQI